MNEFLSNKYIGRQKGLNGNLSYAIVGLNKI